MFIKKHTFIICVRCRNILIFLTFSFWPQYCQMVIMGKGIRHLKKHSHRNWPLPSPNTTFFVPPWSVSSPQNDSTIYFFATMISPNWPSYVSNITTTNQVDTDFNNDDDLQYFATFRNTIAFPIEYVIQIIHLAKIRIL